MQRSITETNTVPMIQCPSYTRSPAKLKPNVISRIANTHFMLASNGKGGPKTAPLWLLRDLFPSGRRAPELLGHTLNAECLFDLFLERSELALRLLHDAFNGNLGAP